MLFYSCLAIELIDKGIIAGLKAVGAVRNAFNHNLEYDSALNCLTASNKFVFANKQSKKLSTYKDVETLKNDFISVANFLYSSLHELGHKIEKQ